MTRWTSSKLYTTLVHCLPLYTDNPFAQTPKLNVGKLCTAIGMSHEGLYKWLRKGRLKADNATMLLTLANREDNAAVLRQLGRDAPKIEDFVPLVF